MQKALVSFDSGFAIAGWARWREGAHPADAKIALRRFDRGGLITTSPDNPEPQRLAELAEAVEAVLRDTQDALALRKGEWPDVAIEVPSVPFASRKRAQGVQDLTLGCGAMIAAAARIVGCSSRVIMMPAPAGRWAAKPKKHAWLRAQFDDAGLPWPTGMRGGAMPDLYDAIWLGVQVLRTPPMGKP